MEVPRQTSLVLRATWWILSIVALIGAISVWWSDRLMHERETMRINDQLHQLLDTVEPSASIACFVSDQELAREVSQGLLSNQIVRQVVIRTGAGVLAQATRVPEISLENPADSIHRQLRSPFNPDEIVGEILLAPDPVELKKRVAQAAHFIVILLIMQILAIGITVVLVVYRLITRPIKRIVDRLHDLPVERGEILADPYLHERDELGELVHYINRMIMRLVGVLDEERDLRLQHEIEERKFRSIFENADTGIFLADQNGKVLSYNPACLELVQAMGRAKTEPISRIANFFNNDATQMQEMIQACLRENKNIQRDINWVGGKSRSAHWVHVTLSQVGDGLFQGVANDITERKLAEISARKVATTDALTGILNRLGFETRLQSRLNQGYERPEFWSALMLIDLDFFKQVNDTYGHDAGDRILVGFARLLERVVRKSDLVGRLGGDEFVLFIDRIDQIQVVEKISKNIIAGVAEPIGVGGGQTARIGASIGIALSRSACTSQEQLFKRADEAMYQAKKDGRNTYCIRGDAQR